MAQGRVYIASSATGQVCKINGPSMIAGMFAPTEYVQALSKAAQSPAEPKSAKLHERFGLTLDGVLCAYRPIDLYLFAYALSLNTYHARCCEIKTKDITQRPWKIVGETKGKARDEVQTFLDKAFGAKDFEEGFGNMWLDYEGIGNGYVEVVPQRGGDNPLPAQLNHVPGTEVWIRLDGLGYLQQKNGLFSHFKVYGADPDIYAKQAAINPNDPVLKAQTSLISIHRYVSWSEFYGIPCIMPAWNRMALTVLETEHNLQFFNNNAIPDYAIILGGEWEEDADKKIQDYFREHLKGKAHKTAVFTTPTGATITFQLLTGGNAKEASFRLLRQDCRDEIINAHGVPPQKVGIQEKGRLGNGGDEQLDDYKDTVVTPGQQKFSKIVNRIIEPFGTDLKFQAEPYSTDDKKANAVVDDTYLKDKVLVPNEVRRIRFPDLPPLPGGDEPLSANTNAPPDPGLTSLQMACLKAIRKEAAL